MQARVSFIFDEIKEAVKEVKEAKVVTNTEKPAVKKTTVKKPVVKKEVK